MMSPWTWQVSHDSANTTLADDLHIPNFAAVIVSTFEAIRNLVMGMGPRSTEGKLWSIEKQTVCVPSAPPDGAADLVERLLELVAAQRRVVQEGLADLRERFQGLVPHSIGRWIGGGNDRARGVLHASYTLGLLP